MYVSIQQTSDRSIKEMIDLFKAPVSSANKKLRCQMIQAIGYRIIWMEVCMNVENQEKGKIKKNKMAKVQPQTITLTLDH